MDLIALKEGREIASLRVESIGGGDIRIPGRRDDDLEEIYVEHSFAEIADFCKWRYIHTLSDYVELNEGPEIWDFLMEVWQVMKRSIDEGLAASGVLPGGLNVQRKAKYLYEQRPKEDIPALLEFQQIAAFAYAVAEQNAGNGNLSRQRVQAVAKILTQKHGISASRIKTAYKGDTVQPFAANDDNRVVIGTAVEK